MIYDASIDLIVESLNKTELAILKLITDHGGFLAESEQNSETSERRHGTWRVRMPVDRFESFTGGVSGLGEVRRNHVGTQDVTENTSTSRPAFATSRRKRSAWSSTSPRQPAISRTSWTLSAS